MRWISGVPRVVGGAVRRIPRPVFGAPASRQPVDLRVPCGASIRYYLRTEGVLKDAAAWSKVRTMLTSGAPIDAATILDTLKQTTLHWAF